MRVLRLLTLLVALASACLAESPRELAQRGFKSVVLLAMNDVNGQPLCIGSGFFVADDIIATNAHVIEGAGGGSAKLVGEQKTFQILGTLAVDRHADLALLKVETNAPSLHLSNKPIPTVGDTLYVIGSPLGLEGTFSEGILSGIRTTGNDSILQMTAPISPGSSGGPVMDSDGEVIGVAVATFKQGQNLNLAVPVSYLAHMLETRSNSVVPLEQTPQPQNKSATLLDGLGARSEQGVFAADLSVDTSSYGLRLVNRLPVVASEIDVIVIFYSETSGKVLNFHRFKYVEPIPAGLAKPVHFFLTDGTLNNVATWHRGKHGAPDTYSYKAEARVIGFKTGDSQY